MFSFGLFGVSTSDIDLCQKVAFVSLILRSRSKFSLSGKFLAAGQYMASIRPFEVHLYFLIGCKYVGGKGEATYLHAGAMVESRARERHTNIL